ncbi:metallophosphoesterase family protein [Kallotenue papyrolyticum]|uniref:metallophosphoesterase family protein n=1 Tax=Kallotenue papyrolyticum TaxID=1325125 RepID=UPI00047856D0|nr:metallophosphoesterase family protein [Kallotenue papyrolyticum]
MRIVLISDIHSNAVALDAVLEALPPYDELWCLGDTIGYGPEPNRCLRLVRERATHALTGNHDLASLGLISLADFNPLARIANEWNHRQLEPELRAYLEALPARLDLPNATLAHGTPRDPVWEYLLDPATGRANLAHFSTPICWVGHSHLATIFLAREDGSLEFRLARAGETLQLSADARYILNPGSVGQPRDGDPRAAYALWDTEQGTVRFQRVAYDVQATQRLMRAAGLPAPLAERLAFGR